MPTNGKASVSCHTNNHDNNKIKSIQTPYILKKRDGRVFSDCCFKSLTNIFPDLNERIELVSIDRTQSAIVDNVKCHLKKLTSNSLRDHDPPDLQIANSTFLL